MSDTRHPEEWQGIQEQMQQWRRDLHRLPELGLYVPETSLYVQSVLGELGVPFHTLLDGNAVVGLIEGAGPGKCIALRADMDGLPVREETGLPFASTNGNMHACGHDGHMAMLLGAAAWLVTHRESFTGSIKLLFQPAEESPGGAKPMIEAGCLENPHVDAVFGLHAGAISTELPEATVGFRSGPLMAAVDKLQIVVHGKGGHAAYPQTTVDPITLAAELVLALQTLVSREKSPVDPLVLSITCINGGRGMNVIPDSVELLGTVRTMNPETRVWLARRIREVSEQLAASRGAAVEIKHDFIYPALFNDKSLTALAMAAARKVLGEQRVYELTEPVMGGEDFAFLAEAVPGVYAFQYSMASTDGEIYPHHTSRFDIDEASFSEGARLHVQVALDFLGAVDA